MRRQAIALLLDHPIGEYQEELSQAVERAAFARDLNLFTVIGRALDAPRRTEASLNPVYDLVSSESVVGVIVAGVVATQCLPERLRSLRDELRPLALCSIGARIPDVPLLAVDDRSAMRLMLDHMVQHERRRIAFLRGPVTSVEAEQRYAAYLDCLHDNQLQLDPDLVSTGNFDLPSGALAMQAILRTGAPFDAVVASNDHMALGAAEVLQAHGLRIPHQVLVGGFDDFPLARFANPPLTTVRQPLGELGRRAVETLLAQLKGDPVEAVAEVSSALVLRQSCGCALRGLHKRKSVLPRSPANSPLELLRQRREPLRRLLLASTQLAEAALGGWLQRLFLALEAELCGEPGRFLLELEDLLELAVRQHETVDEFHAVVSVLRAELKSAADSTDGSGLDDLWHAAGILVGVASARAEGRERLASEFAAGVIRDSIARLSTTLSHSALKASLLDLLPAVKIPRSLVALWSEEAAGTLSYFFGTRGDARAPCQVATFSARQLVPPGFLSDGEPAISLLVQPLTFEAEQLGLLVLQSGASSVVYSILREQISASLKGAALHQSVAREAALRERAERLQLEGELRIAEQIQTAILPVDSSVPWLEIAARMMPALEVGGDYYDVHPRENTCWVGIGDVTGHGLKAGLVMLMIQSMVSALVEQSPDATPGSLVVALNAALFRNVRERLHLDDYATFSLLRIDPDGTVTWAGAHEDLVVQRAVSGKCELFAPAGTWLGARHDIAHAVVDQTLKLEHGDRLLLFTDGLVEAMDQAREQFGLQRVCALLERSVALDEARLCTLLVEQAKQFAVLQEDDITVLVLRYRRS